LERRAPTLTPTTVARKHFGWMIASSEAMETFTAEP
jgi:hypothetical protein